MRTLKAAVAVFALFMIMGSFALLVPTVSACNNSNIYVSNDGDNFSKVYGVDGNNGDTTASVTYSKTTDIEQGETKTLQFKLTMTPGCGSYYEAMFKVHSKPDGWIVRIYDNTNGVGKAVGTDIDGVTMGSLDAPKEGFSGSVTYYCNVLVTCPADEELGLGSPKYKVEIEVYSEDRACNDEDHIYVGLPFRVVERHDAPVVAVTSPVSGSEFCQECDFTYTATDTETDDSTLKIDLFYKEASGTSYFIALGNKQNTGTLTWNFSSLADGDYVVMIKATDSGVPRKSGSGTVNIIINNPSAPDVALTYPGPEEELTHQNEIEIEWTATDEEQDSEDIKIDLYYSMGSVTKWNEITVDEENDGSYLWNISSLDDRPDYRIKIVAKDPTGLSAELYSRKQAVNNLDGPVVSNLYPTGGQTFSNDMTIYWTAADADGDPLVVNILWSTDRGETFETLIDSLSNTGKCSYKVDTTQYPDGHDYVIKLEATDGELTGSRESEAFSIFNNDDPTVSITGPVTGTRIGGTINITWEAEDEDENEELNLSVFFKIGLSSWDPIIQNQPDQGYVLWETDNEDLGLREEDGTYQIKVVVEDLHRGLGEDILDGVEVFNPDEPTVDVSFPEDGALVKGMMTFDWDVEDKDVGDNPAVTLKYNVDGDSKNITVIKENLPPVGTFTWDTSTVEDGVYDFHIMADDGVFEFSDIIDDVEIRNYVNHKPVVDITNPTTDLMFMGNISIDWTATDGNPEDVLTISVSYSIDTIDWTFIQEEISNIGSVDWDTATVEDGSYYIKIVASDGNGNDGTKMVGPFMVENVQDDKNPNPTNNNKPVEKDEGMSSGILVAIIVALVVVLILIVVGVFFVMKKLNSGTEKPLPIVPNTPALPPQNVSSGSVKDDPFGNSSVDDIFK